MTTFFAEKEICDIRLVEGWFRPFFQIRRNVYQVWLTAPPCRENLVGRGKWRKVKNRDKVELDNRVRLKKAYPVSGRVL